MSRLDDIKGRAEKFANLCPDYMAQGIRHLERNCDLDCHAEVQNPYHDCTRPDKYDGEDMAKALGDLAALVAVVEEVQARAEDLYETAERLHPTDPLTAAGLRAKARNFSEVLRPLTGGPQ